MDRLYPAPHPRDGLLIRLSQQILSHVTEIGLEVQAVPCMGTSLPQSLVPFDPRGINAGLLYEGWRKENLFGFFPLNEVVCKYEVWKAEPIFLP